MSKYLQDKAEGYVAKWIMETPDAVQELDAYWFYSMTGKAIVWSVIKARKSGPITLETIKQHSEQSKNCLKTVKTIKTLLDNDSKLFKNSRSERIP